MTRDTWDQDDMRPAVRDAFQKVLDCGTAALGAEVFASPSEERVVYHTCKSRACLSCGHRATLAWQRDQWRELPDIPYSHVSLTMPNVLWPLFQRNRHLLPRSPRPGGSGAAAVGPEEIWDPADDRRHSPHVRPPPELQLSPAHPGVGGRTQGGWDRLAQTNPVGQERPDADVAVRHHQVPAGGRPGGHFSTPTCLAACC